MKTSYILALSLLLPCMSHAMDLSPTPLKTVSLYIHENKNEEETRLLFKIFKNENTYGLMKPEREKQIIKKNGVTSSDDRFYMNFFTTCNDNKCFKIRARSDYKENYDAGCIENCDTPIELSYFRKKDLSKEQNKTIPIIKSYCKLTGKKTINHLKLTKINKGSLCTSKSFNNTFLKEIEKRNHSEFSKKLQNYPKFDVVVHAQD